jgi:hypothetical protein
MIEDDRKHVTLDLTESTGSPIYRIIEGSWGVDVRFKVHNNISFSM